MIATYLYELIQDRLFLNGRRLLIPFMNRLQMISFGSLRHANVLHACHPCSPYHPGSDGKKIQCPTMAARASFQITQVSFSIFQSVNESELWVSDE